MSYFRYQLMNCKQQLYFTMNTDTVREQSEGESARLGNELTGSNIARRVHDFGKDRKTNQKVWKTNQSGTRNVIAKGNIVNHFLGDVIGAFF